MLQLRITIECDYALRIVLYLARLGTENKADAATIAEVQKIPQRFSSKILRKLTLGGIIRSYKGVKGGYSLQKLPEDITMLEIVELIDGDVEVTRCIDTDYDCSCGDRAACPIHYELASINHYLKEKLGSVNFASFL